MGFHNSSGSIAPVMPRPREGRNEFLTVEDAEDAIEMATFFTVSFFSGEANHVSNLNSVGIELFIQEFYRKGL